MTFGASSAKSSTAASATGWTVDEPSMRTEPLRSSLTDPVSALPVVPLSFSSSPQAATPNASALHATSTALKRWSFKVCPPL